MRFGRKINFEVLEDRRVLAVTASVTAGGDLLVQGTADGAVEIVAVGNGAYQVTDNGVVVAGADVLQGVTDDVRISLRDGAAATDAVTLDLGGQAVDEVDVKLGNGDNSFRLLNGTADALKYRGGNGADAVELGAAVEETAAIGLGRGDNTLAVTGAVGRLHVKGGDGDDGVTIDAAATIGGAVKLILGGGDNTAAINGTIEGALAYEGRDGNDFVTIADTASIVDDFYARLGEGDNSVTHAGSVGGDFNVTSANAEDLVDITAAATIGGETTLGLGEQTGRGGHGGHGGRGGCGGQGGDDGQTETGASASVVAAQTLTSQVTGLPAGMARLLASALVRGGRR